jgi:hypothetical protein
MTLPSSGYLLLGADGGASGRSVNSEFGYGNDMASYQGVYYGKGGNEYRFPLPGNSISMGGGSSPNDAGFYSTYKITGGSQTFNSSTTAVIPVYNTISVTVTGGGGGQAGQYGIDGCNGNNPTPSAGGGGGGTSSFGGYVSAGGGNGGGGSQGLGNPGQTVNNSFTNPVQGGNGPTSGSSLYVSIGNGGSGGTGGYITILIQTGNTGFPNYQPIYGCFPAGNAARGADGAVGSVNLSWS